MEIQYRYATDSESGFIKAFDFDEACQILADMVPHRAVLNGAWGWVEDFDGDRFEIGSPRDRR